MVMFFFQAEDGIRDLVRSRGLGDVYKRQTVTPALVYEVPPIDIPRGFNVENAAAIRQGTGLILSLIHI